MTAMAPVVVHKPHVVLVSETSGNRDYFEGLARCGCGAAFSFSIRHQSAPEPVMLNMVYRNHFPVARCPTCGATETDI